MFYNVNTFIPSDLGFIILLNNEKMYQYIIQHVYIYEDLFCAITGAFYISEEIAELRNNNPHVEEIKEIIRLIYQSTNVEEIDIENLNW